MATLRTFLAIETPDEVQSQAARLIDQLSRVQAPVRWVEPENLHFTLKFLGDVNLTDTAEICRRVARVTAAWAPIDLIVEGLGAFPSIERPRTIWVGASDGGERLAELCAAIEETLAEMGFNREQRRFTPHITIGRVRGTKQMQQLAELLQEHDDFLAGPMTADEVVLFSSERAADGPFYQSLGRARLDG